MRIEITQKEIAVYLDNPERKDEHVVDLNSYLCLPSAQVRRLLEVTKDRIEGKRYKTQAGYLRCSVGMFGH